MGGVHPTAILEGGVELGSDVEIGPYCVLRGPIRLGDGTRLLASVHLQGPLRLGEGNLLYPGTCIGFAPQSTSTDPARPGPGTEIGDRNTFREAATVHRAMTDAGPTRIGDDNYFMVGSHVGHDARVGSGCILANNATLGGHTEVGDGAVLGGHAAVHQFCRVGRGAMMSGLVGITLDLPPFFLATGHNAATTVNVVGMRRAGMPSQEIADVRWVHRTLYGSPRGRRAQIEALRERAGRPRVAEYIEFLEASKRGICRGRPDPRR